LCQGEEELASILNRVLLIASGDPSQPQSFLLYIGGSRAAQFNVRVERQPQSWDNS
jgi:hypothetical protein